MVAPTHFVAVDDVVVDHQGRMQQFDGGAHLGRGTGIAAPQGVMGAHHECRPEPFAAFGRRRQAVPQAGVIRAIGSRSAPASVQ